MGYWIVVAMLACAVAAVAAALVAEPLAEPAAERESSARPPRAADPDRPLRWVAMGASDAAGFGTADPARLNWVALIAADLPARVRTRNLAVPGSTLADARREQLPDALASEADVVSLWLVVNDVLAGVPLGAYERELAGTLRALREAGCEVVLGNLLDLSRLPSLLAAGFDPAALRGLVQRWNASIARLAAAHGATLVDLAAHSEHLAERPEFLGPDGFHPSEAGQAALADLFRPAVQAALERAAATPFRDPWLEPPFGSERHRAV